MNNITRHYCLIDYYQQFAAVDQVCCRKMSFFKMAVPHRAMAHYTVKKIKKMCWELLHHLPYSPDLASSTFNLFGPHNKSLGNIKFKNDEDVLQHFVRKFLQVPIKNLMLQVPADLKNNRNIAVNCRENMLKSNITVRNVRFTVVVLKT